MMMSSSQQPAPSKPAALITGASSGIGEEYARQLAAQGYALVLVARRAERLQAIRDELAGRFGVEVEVCTADLARREDLERVAGRIAQIPQLELLINNAGFGTMGSFADVEIGPQLDMVELHAAAPLRLIRAALPGMIQRHRGAIINVASLAAFVIGPGSATYGATKAFLNHFSESLQVELTGTGVRVQSLCPGFTYTGFHDTAELSRFDRAQIPRALWMSCEPVVAASLRQLDSGGVICIPGALNRWLVRLMQFRLAQRIAGRIARKKFSSRGQGVGSRE